MDNTIYNIYVPKKSAFQYLITPYNLNTFYSELVDGTLTGFSIAGLFQNLNDYVVSSVYFPISIDAFCHTLSNESIILGKETTSVSALPVDHQLPYVQIATFFIAKPFDNFLSYAPYTKISLSVPFFEPIELEPRYVYNKTCYIYMSVDLASGHATIYVTDGSISSRIIATKSAQLGIVVPLGKTNEQEQQRNNILQGINLVGSIGGLVYGASSGNGLAIAGGLALATRTATTLIQNNVDAIRGYTGMQGNRDGLCVDKKVYLIIEKPQIISEPDASLVGKPCMKTLNLSTLTGFNKISEIHFNPMERNIYQDEIQEIVSLLKEGVIL